MEFVGLMVLLVLGALIAMPIWSLIAARNLRQENRRLVEELAALQTRLGRLERAAKNDGATDQARPAGKASPEMPPAKPEPKTVRSDDVLPVVSVTPVPPPLPVKAPVAMPTAGKAAQPLKPVMAPEPVARREERKAERRPVIQWEWFMGVKLFAWVGGFALFLAVAFFVKYSFEHDLIPPEVRVALGYLVSIGLLVGGVWLRRQPYVVTAQTLAATGVVSLYAVTFASHAVYHFPFFGPVATFALMALVTTVAFLLAVRMEARVVAVLGLVGGFVTPVLLSTGVDNPGGLFGYVALLDLGLLAVALHRRWGFLAPLGGVGTLGLLLGWTGEYFAVGKIWILIGASGGLAALFIGAAGLAVRWKRESLGVGGTALAAAFVPIGLAFYALSFAGLGARPGVLFLYLAIGEVLVIAAAGVTRGAGWALSLAGGLAFAFLGSWTVAYLTAERMPWALGAVLGFAVPHTALPLVIGGRRPDLRPPGWTQLGPPLALGLLLSGVICMEGRSWWVWPAALAVDAIAIGLAWTTRSLAAVAACLVLTLVAAGVWIVRIPGGAAAPAGLLAVVGGFALVFLGAGLGLARRMPEAGPAGSDLRRGLPVMAVLMPFTLLVLVTLQTRVDGPSAVFGLALLLVVLALGLAWLLVLEWLPLATLAGVFALEAVWLEHGFGAGTAGVSVGWFAGFYAIFLIYPPVAGRRFLNTTGPWIAAALAAAGHFWLIYRAVKQAWPNDWMGALPAGFAVAALTALALAARLEKPNEPRQLTRLAWGGGVALLFITLIFPVQFSREWLTLGWALEGAALLWLHGRVPHEGLRRVGLALLAVVFARLALNPDVLGYHARTAAPILNWYLYTYGVAIACFAAAARLPALREAALGGIRWSPVSAGGAVVLGFVLVNLEIADFFSPGGTAVVLRFSGSFAMDLTYTIAWALFAFGLLSAGVWRRVAAARYAALGLLAVTLGKLFFHDLANLAQLYRIAALAVVAVIAILASFVYQRFLPKEEKHEKD